MHENHPYYPPGVGISGGYAPNTLTLPVLLGTFSSVLCAYLSAVLLIARKVDPSLGNTDLLTLAWFALCEPSFIYAVCLLALQPPFTHAYTETNTPAAYPPWA